MMKQKLVSLGWFSAILIAMLLSFTAGFYESGSLQGVLMVGLIVVWSARTAMTLRRAPVSV